MDHASSMGTSLKPRLDKQYWRFVIINPANAPQLLGSAIGTFREDEGITAIVPVRTADELGLEGPDFGRISLMIHTGLEEVGLTAIIATALAAPGIACNMVAAFHHDHAFVPAARADEAMAILEGLEISL